MRLSLLFCFLCILLFGCKKEDKKAISEEKPTITLSKTQATPGDLVQIKLNRKISSQEVQTTFNSDTVKAYAVSDSSYAFIIPVVAPGQYSVSIPSFAGLNTAILTISPYTPITNPQVIIDDFVAKRNRSIDSITKIVTGSNYQPSTESLNLINQLKDEWVLQMSKISANERLFLAYVLEKNMLEPGLHSFTPLPAGYYAKVSGLQENIGDKLVAQAKSYVTVNTVCLGTIPVLTVSGVAFIIAPNPLSAAIFLGSFTTFIISRESAIRRAKEVGHLKGVAETIMDASANKTASTEFYNDTEKELSLSINFRNLNSADSSIQEDISAAFAKEGTFIKKDEEVKSLYTKGINYLTKLVGTYPGYNPIIGKQPSGSLLQSISGNEIIVKGVSDNQISFTTSVSGTQKKIKINSNSKSEISFTVKVAYKRSLDQREFVKDIACVFKPHPTEGVTVAGGNGRGGAANQFDSPYGFAFDASGNLFVVDAFNHRVQKWAPGASAGVTVAGGNGQGAAANQLSLPIAIALDASGNLYISDYANNRIQKWAPGASTGVTVAGGNGSGSAANQFDHSGYILIDASGNLYIADIINNRIQKWAPGASSGITVAGGNGKGSGANQLSDPAGLAMDRSGNLYIAEATNDRITKWAPGAREGVTIASGEFFTPRGIFLDELGNLYIADSNHSRVQKWSPGATSGVTVAGGNGQGAAANQLFFPECLIVKDNYLYISDNGNQRIQRWLK